jgi:hypothetical protein
MNVFFEDRLIQFKPATKYRKVAGCLVGLCPHFTIDVALEAGWRTGHLLR